MDIEKVLESGKRYLASCRHENWDYPYPHLVKELIAAIEQLQAENADLKTEIGMLKIRFKPTEGGGNVS